jgi:hypothetical protein
VDEQVTDASTVMLFLAPRFLLAPPPSRSTLLRVGLSLFGGAAVVLVKADDALCADGWTIWRPDPTGAIPEVPEGWSVAERLQRLDLPAYLSPL